MTFGGNKILHIFLKIIFCVDAYICFKQIRRKIKLLHIYQEVVHVTGSTPKNESNEIKIITFHLIFNSCVQYLRKKNETYVSVIKYDVIVENFTIVTSLTAELYTFYTHYLLTIIVRKWRR